MNEKRPLKDQYYILFLKICQGLTFVLLLYFILFYALYKKGGYYQMATVKFAYLRWGLTVYDIIIAPFAVLCLVYFLRDFRKENKTGSSGEKQKELKYRKWVDTFALFYPMIQLTSYSLSPYKTEALWGTESWYMGLLTQLLCLGLYFAVSRFGSRIRMLTICMLAVTFIIALWGILNRYGVYPIDMEYVHPEFLSAMGNINWLCGYYVIFLPLGMGLYLDVNSLWKRMLLGIYLVVSLTFMLLQGSDSGVVTLFAVYVLLGIGASLQRKRFARFLEIPILFEAGCLLFRGIDLWKPERRTMNSGFMTFFLGENILWMLVISGSIYWLYRVLDGKQILQQKHLIFLYKAFIYFLGFLFGVGILLMTYQTVHQKQDSVLADHSIWNFDENWGSGRGRIWRDSLYLYGQLDPVHKWIGIGPDCFGIWGRENPQCAKRLSVYGNSRLTNAHNEELTLLVNVGILGLAGFLGMTGTAVFGCLRMKEENFLRFLFGLGVAAYLVHNLFSFEQVLNLPYMYIMLGLCMCPFHIEDVEEKGILKL